MKELDWFFKRVERPSRYLGQEVGVVRHCASVTKLNFVLGFPDLYEIGMSHLGFRLLYGGLATREDINVERVFLPAVDAQHLLIKRDKKLFSIESKTPIRNFDIFALSLQYELSLPAVVRMLDLAGIPRWRWQRQDPQQHWPIIMAGGPIVTNPLPIEGFFDCLFIGEADEAIIEIVDCLVKHSKTNKNEQLEALGEIEGVYLPKISKEHYSTESFGRRFCLPEQPLKSVKRRCIKDIDKLPIPVKQLVPFCPLVHDRVTIEIQRGCTHGCRFCQAGFISRPVRQRTMPNILQLAENNLTSTGYNSLSLLSLSAGDHPNLLTMLGCLTSTYESRGIKISLPSLRTETLNREILSQIQSFKKFTFTLAPEAGSERLRRVINKQNNREDLFNALRFVHEAGFGQLKLYFMIGLPTETEQDIDEMIDLIKDSYNLLMKSSKTRRTKMSVSVSTFIPKPHTPFQWEAVASPQQIQQKQKRLRDALWKHVPIKFHDTGQSLVEAYLARGDQRVSLALDKLVTPDYTAMDAWTDFFELKPWLDVMGVPAAQESSKGAPAFEFIEEIDTELRLPWDHVDLGVDKQYLLDERIASRNDLTQPDCRYSACQDCGACSTDLEHRLACEKNTLTENVAADVGNQDENSHPQVVYRIWFEKRNLLKFLSHLECVTLFERALRRIGAPLWLSQGYNPKPVMRFSPALPLGAESLCEFLEVSLRREMTDLQGKLSVQLPEGINIQRIETVTGSWLKRITGIRWRFCGDEDIIKQVSLAKEILAGQDHINWKRKDKNCEMLTNQIQLTALDANTVEAQITVQDKAILRPAEIMSLLLGFNEEQIRDTHVMRIEWIVSK